MTTVSADVERLLTAGRQTSARLATLPGVIAIAQGGSAATTCADERSDVDLYVYCDTRPRPADRSRAAGQLARPGTELVDHGYFEGGDLWVDRDTGASIDVMYRTASWMEDRIAAVLGRHEPSLGYSTAILFNIQTCVAIHDPSGWLSRVQERARIPYPDALADAIVRYNLPMLQTLPFSYRRELEFAAFRGDVPAAIHVADRFLASYFDILFALNRAPHPGEKRLLPSAERLARVPPDLGPLVAALIAQSSSQSTLPAAVETSERLIDGLEPFI